MHYFVIILNSIVQNYSVFLITSPETIFLITLSPSYRLENISTVFHDSKYAFIYFPYSSLR